MDKQALNNITLRFDDDNHSLSKENGLSIGDIGKLLSSIERVVKPKAGERLVLSEVRGNCYALNLYSETIRPILGVRGLHTILVYLIFIQGQKHT